MRDMKRFLGFVAKFQIRPHETKILEEITHLL